MTDRIKATSDRKKQKNFRVTSVTEQQLIDLLRLKKYPTEESAFAQAIADLHKKEFPS